MSKEDKECFVIMPFGEAESQSGLQSELVFEHVIEPAFKKANVNGNRIDKEIVQGPLKDAIKTKLREAAVVIADISDNNPNVLFELGFRHGQGKPIICISSRPKDAVFWPATFQIIDYSNPHRCVDILANHISSVFDRMESSGRTGCALDTIIDFIRQPGYNKKIVNPLQDRVAAWRLNLVLSHIKHIHDFNWSCQVKDKDAYVEYMLEGILDLLGENDEFLTITNFDFWSNQQAIKTLFLTANIVAAKKGIIVKRIFIVDQRLWENLNGPSQTPAQKIILKHLDASKEVEETGIGQLIVRFYISEKLNKAKEHYGHFAILRDSSQKNCIVAEPIKSNGQISDIRFIFSDPNSDRRSSNTYVRKFEELFEKSQELLKYTKAA